MHNRAFAGRRSSSLTVVGGRSLTLTKTQVSPRENACVYRLVCWTKTCFPIRLRIDCTRNVFRERVSVELTGQKWRARRKGEATKKRGHNAACWSMPRSTDNSRHASLTGRNRLVLRAFSRPLNTRWLARIDERSTAEIREQIARLMVRAGSIWLIPYLDSLRIHNYKTIFLFLEKILSRSFYRVVTRSADDPNNLFPLSRVLVTLAHPPQNKLRKSNATRSLWTKL